MNKVDCVRAYVLAQAVVRCDYHSASSKSRSVVPLLLPLPWPRLLLSLLRRTYPVGFASPGPGGRRGHSGCGASPASAAAGARAAAPARRVGDASAASGQAGREASRAARQAGRQAVRRAGLARRPGRQAASLVAPRAEHRLPSAGARLAGRPTNTVPITYYLLPITY